MTETGTGNRPTISSITIYVWADDRLWTVDFEKEIVNTGKDDRHVFVAHAYAGEECSKTTIWSMARLRALTHKVNQTGALAWYCRHFRKNATTILTGDVYHVFLDRDAIRGYLPPTSGKPVDLVEREIDDLLFEVSARAALGSSAPLPVPSIWPVHGRFLHDVNSEAHLALRTFFGQYVSVVNRGMLDSDVQQLWSAGVYALRLLDTTAPETEGVEDMPKNPAQPAGSVASRSEGEVVKVDWRATPQPKVFISYSHDSDDHKTWVRHIAEELFKGGVYVRLDQWDLKFGMELPAFMEESVAGCDFILVICTPDYARKSNARTGGAGYESTVISSEVFTGGRTKEQVVPAIRRGTDQEAIPTFLLGRLYVDFRGDTNESERIADLLGHFFGKPRFSRPQTTPTPPDVPPSGMAAEQLVELAGKETDPRKKLGFFERAAELHPKADYHRQAAMWALNLNEIELAKSHDLKAVELDPDCTYAWVGLAVEGGLLQDRELLERAFAEVKKQAAPGDNRDVEASFAYGQYLFKAGEWASAHKHLQVVALSKSDDKYFSKIRKLAKEYIREIQHLSFMTPDGKIHTPYD